MSDTTTLTKSTTPNRELVKARAKVEDGKAVLLKLAYTLAEAQRQVDESERDRAELTDRLAYVLSCEMDKKERQADHDDRAGWTSELLAELDEIDRQSDVSESHRYAQNRELDDKLVEARRQTRCESRRYALDYEMKRELAKANTRGERVRVALLADDLVEVTARVAAEKVNLARLIRELVEVQGRVADAEHALAWLGVDLKTLPTKRGRRAPARDGKDD